VGDAEQLNDSFNFQVLILTVKSKLKHEERVTLPEKLRRVFLLRVKEAKTEKEKERAERDLAKLTSVKERNVAATERDECFEPE
jgi:hypothetical protein